MASRHLRRLQNASKLEDEAEINEEEDSPPSTSAKPNLFSLLSEDEGKAVEEDSSDEGSAAREASGEGQQSATSAAKTKASRHKGKSSKKKGGKKAKEGDVQAPAADEDLDKLLQSLDIKIGERPTTNNDAGEPSSSGGSGLDINLRKLKVEDELRRIFGAKFVNSEREHDGNEGPGGFAHASRKVRRLAARGLIKRAKLPPGHIIQPRDDWPRLDRLLTMAQDPDSKLPSGFKYVPSSAYQAAQRLFEETQASHDPNRLIQLTALQPYHVDTLNAASDLYRVSGQSDTADEFLSRSLYALEMAWPSNFQPDRSSINPVIPENRLFFKTLFKYIQTLIRRGLYTTALENAKLLLCTNSQAILEEGSYVDRCLDICWCIDYIAIRARQYAVLELDKVPIWHLPHWTYSKSLADYLKEPECDPALGKGIRAVQQTPSFVVALIAKLEDKGVHPDAKFQQALKHRLFKNACDHGNASLSHLETLYVERQYTLFKEAQNFEWLKQCCIRATNPNEEAQLRNWEVSRKECWPQSDVNHYSFLKLSDFTDDIAALPQGELPWQNGNLMAQPNELGGEEYNARLEELEQMVGNLGGEELNARLQQIANDPTHPLSELLMMLGRGGFDQQEGL